MLRLGSPVKSDNKESLIRLKITPLTWIGIRIFQLVLTDQGQKKGSLKQNQRIILLLTERISLIKEIFHISFSHTRVLFWIHLFTLSVIFVYFFTSDEGQTKVLNGYVVYNHSQEKKKSFTGYLGLGLNRALREEFNLYFSRVLC